MGELAHEHHGLVLLPKGLPRIVHRHKTIHGHAPRVVPPASPSTSPSHK